MSRTLKLDSPYFKCYKIAYQVLDPMTCLLFGWLLNEVNMSSCEDGYGSYVFRSKREIRAEFFQFSERQFNRAWKKLTEDRLIWTDRKRYGFKIYIASNALSILTRKQEALRKKKAESSASENRHNVRYETGNSGQFSGLQNRQCDRSSHQNPDLSDTMKFRHSDDSQRKADPSQCRTSIPLKEQSKVLEETPLEAQRQTTGKDLILDEASVEQDHFYNSENNKTGPKAGIPKPRKKKICAFAKSDTKSLSAPMERYSELEKEISGVPPELPEEEPGFPENWDEIYSSLAEDEPPVDWGSFPQWERDCDEPAEEDERFSPKWEAESFAPESCGKPDDPGSFAPKMGESFDPEDRESEAEESYDPEDFAPDPVENPEEFPGSPAKSASGERKADEIPIGPSCLPHLVIPVPDLPAGKARKTAIASVPISGDLKREPAKPDSDFAKLLDAKHQLKAEAEKKPIPLDEQERRQWKIEEDEFREQEVDDFWTWMETHPEKKDRKKPKPDSPPKQTKTPPGTTGQTPFLSRKKRA